MYLSGRKRIRYDYRTRRDRTQRRIDAFNAQMADMTLAYMKVVHEMGPACNSDCLIEPDSEAIREYKIRIFDIFCKLTA